MIYRSAIGGGRSIERDNSSKVMMQPMAMFWAGFLKEEHRHHSTSIIADFINLIEENLKEWQHKNRKVGPFQPEIQFPEFMCELVVVKLSIVLLAVRGALECKICCKEMGGAIRDQQETIMHCFYFYSQRVLIDFEAYFIYYDIMRIICDRDGGNQKGMHNGIALEKQPVLIDYKYSSLFSGKFGQCGIRLTIVVLLAHAVERSRKGQNRKIVDRVFQLWKQNNQNGDLSKFLIEMIRQKKLTVLLGDYFYNKITLELIDFAKCQTDCDKRHQLICSLVKQTTKIRTNHQISDKKEDAALDIESRQVPILTPETPSHKQQNNSKQICPLPQKQLFPLSIREELQMAIAGLQSSVDKSPANTILEKDISLLSSLKISATIKHRKDRVEVLKRVVDLSRQFPALVQPSIQNSLAILEIPEFVEIMNETIRFSCKQSQETYRLNIRQHLREYPWVAKRINLTPDSS